MNITELYSYISCCLNSVKIIENHKFKVQFIIRFWTKGLERKIETKYFTVIHEEMLDSS